MEPDRNKKDTFIIAIFAGTLAKVVQDILGYITIKYFLPSYLNCVRIAGGIILSHKQVLKGGFWTNLLGFQIDLAVGITVAVVTVLALQKWGKDYLILKGAMAGIFAWALFYVTLSRLLSNVHPFGSILLAEISFLNHLIFGITLTTSAVWFEKRLSGRRAEHK